MLNATGRQPMQAPRPAAHLPALLHTRPITPARLQAAERLQSLRHRALSGAEQRGQRIGLELEFLPRPTSEHPTAALHHRDSVYERMQRHLDSAGIATTQHTDASPVFEIALGQHLYPVLADTYKCRDNTELHIERFCGHGGVILTVAAPDGTATKHALPNISTAFAAQAYAQALVRQYSADPNTRRSRCHLLTKDRTGDTVKIELILSRDASGTLHATLIGLNGDFFTPDAEHPLGNPASDSTRSSITVAITEPTVTTGHASASADAMHQLAIAQLEPLISGAQLMRKHSRHTGLVLPATNTTRPARTLRFIDEEGDALEFVSPVLTLDDRPLIRQIVGGLQAQGYIGTRPTADGALGIHLHLDVPLQHHNQFSCAPLYNMLTSFLKYRSDFVTLLPPANIRTPYTLPLSDTLITRLYTVHAHTNHNRVADLLALQCDIVRFTRGKGHEINCDNYIAATVAALVQSGTLTFGATLETTIGDVAYHFTVVRDNATNAPNIHYHLNDGAPPRPLARMSTGPNAPITTVELRLFDTFHTAYPNGRYGITPEAVVELIELGAALAYDAQSNENPSNSRI